MNFDYKFGKVGVNIPSTDEGGWYTIEQQSFMIDKREFILKHFKTDFPNVKVKDYDQFEKVLNRSTKLQEWYQKVSLLYADSIQLPVAFKENFDPVEYKEFFKDMTRYKQCLVNESKEIEELSMRFNEDLSIIKDNWKSKRDEIVNINQVYKILTLTADRLPISLQIEIENYTPSTGDVLQKKRLYAREMLITYQKALLEVLKQDDSIDLEVIIEENSVK